MAVEIGALRALLSLDSSAFERGARRAEASMNRVQQRLSRMGRGMRDFGRSMSTRVTAPLVAMAALAGGASVRAAEQIERLAEISGTSTTEFQRLAAAAETVGIENDQLADIFRDMQDRVGDFMSTGGGPMADFFENVAPQVGVTADQFARLSGPEALQLFVSSLEQANLSQSEMVFYMEAMASDATELLPLLRDNGAEMERLGDRAQRLGAIMDQDTIEALTNTRQALRDLTAAGAGFRNEIMAALAPQIERLAEGAVRLAERFSELSPRTQRIIAGIGGLAAAIGPVAIALGFLATGLATLASPIGLAVLAFGALAGVAATVALKWDEFSERFPGVASVIRGVINTVEGVIAGLVETISGVVAAIDAIIQGDWRALWQAAQQIFEGLFTTIDSLFGGLPSRIVNWITATATEVAETMRQFGRDIVRYIVEGIREGAESVRQAITDILTFDEPAAATAPQGPLGQMRAVGVSMGEGLAQGINSTTGNAAQAGANAAAAAERGAREESETQSPSRRWMELGRDLMDGLGIGIADRAQAAGQAAAAAAQQATEAATQQIDTAMDRASQAAEGFGSRFASFLMPIINGTQSIGDAFQNMARRVSSSFLQQGLQGLGQQLFSGFSGFGGKGGGFFSTMMRGFQGFFANGGTLGAGQWGIAGEAGPEPVVGPARIIPNSAMGGATINMKTEIINNAPGVDVEEQRSRGANGEEISRFVVTKKDAANGGLDAIMRGRYGVTPKVNRR